MKTALVIGATGLVGSQLVKLLLADSRFDKVIVFVRRASRITHAKLQENIIDFNTPGNWQHLVKGDVFFSTLGTTLSQAGSKKAQYIIDHDYQYEFAKTAASNGVPVYVLISSAGANENAKIFYSRMKGELETKVKKLPFASTTIIQPGLLAGHRENERFGEIAGFKVLNALNAFGLLKKYRPIQGEMVAKAMINAGLSSHPGVHVYTLDKVFELAT